MDLILIVPLILFVIYRLSKRGPAWLSRPLGVILLEAVAVGVLVLYLWWSSFPDPRFTPENLQGLTPDQVTNRLGPPEIDPRLPKWGSWTSEEASNERLVFSYSGGIFFAGGRYNWQGFSYGVVFKNDHVVDVKIGHK